MHGLSRLVEDSVRGSFAFRRFIPLEGTFLLAALLELPGCLGGAVVDRFDARVIAGPRGSGAANTVYLNLERTIPRSCSRKRCAKNSPTVKTGGLDLLVGKQIWPGLRLSFAGSV